MFETKIILPKIKRSTPQAGRKSINQFFDPPWFLSIFEGDEIKIAKILQNESDN